MEDTVFTSLNEVGTFKILKILHNCRITNNTKSILLRSILWKDELYKNDTNFMDWIQTLRIVLRQEDKLYILDWSIPKRTKSLSCLRLCAQNSNKCLEHLEAYAIGVGVERHVSKGKLSKKGLTSLLHSFIVK